jgi:chemotaxis protein MotB
MIVMGLAAIAMAAGLGGCSNSLSEENKLLHTENQQLRDQLNDRNSALDSAQAELRDRDMQLAHAESNTSPEAGDTYFEGIDGVVGEVGGGMVTAIVEGDVLFDPGKTSLKPAAKKSLDQVAAVLNTNYSGKLVRIAGHTDSDPIRKSGYKSNHHLGFERAYAVREYLATRGVSAERMMVESFGPDEPRGDKAQSRRVEIAVLMN